MKKKLSDIIVPALKREFPQSPTWKAFAQWWLLTKGLDSSGTAKENFLVDGSKDGGFDVIAWPMPGFNEKDIYAIQSKYYKSMPNIKNLDRFLQAINAVRGPRRIFNDWLDTVSDSLRNHYEHLREQRKYARFVLITTAKLHEKNVRYLKQQNIEVHDRDSIRRLFHFYECGQTPRVDLLKFQPLSKVIQITKTDKVRMWTFSVHLKEIAKAFQNHRNLLFAGNIRHALSGGSANQVRKGINDTLLKHPEEFIFSHNGITVVAQGIKKQNKSIVLYEPSIVNGAQTVTFIGQKWLHKIDKKNASVFIRLIEVLPGVAFETLETDVAIRSNTQNKVPLSDLIVNEPRLVDLQRHLLRKQIYLERKKGEKPPFPPSFRITKERLVQLFSCLEKELGPTAPKRLQELFKSRDHNAVDMIRSYVNEKKINEVVALIWLDNIMQKVINGFAQPVMKRRGKLAYFAIYTTTVHALRKANAWNKLTTSLSSAENYSDEVYRVPLIRLIKRIRSFMLSCSKRAKKNEPAFYKNKEQTNNAVRKVTKKVRRMAKEIYKLR